MLLPLAIALAVAASPHPLSAAEPCPPKFARLLPASTLSSDASFSAIARAYRRLRPMPAQREIDAQRLINPSDWNKARAKFPASPWDFYGHEVFEDWEAGLRYVNRDADGAALGENLLKKIHHLTMRHHFYRGYEGRRIRALYDRGEISREELQKRLKPVYEEKKSASGKDHAELSGAYREDALDEVQHHGSSFLPDGSRYFTAAELAALRRNPYIRVEESSIRKVGAGAFKGHAYYSPVKDIPTEIRAILYRTREALAQEKRPEAINRLIYHMERDLLSVHPFLDGNGRSIRLLGDLLRQRHGLPPPLYPLEDELTLPEAEALEFQRKAMLEYVNQAVSAAMGKNQ
jgi:hypothetical protein